MSSKSPRTLRKRSVHGERTQSVRMRQTKQHPTELTANNYIVCIDSERLYQSHRFVWTICLSNEPDQLVSWGYAPTRELAEVACIIEVRRLGDGLTSGGRVKSPRMPPRSRVPLLSK